MLRRAFLIGLLGLCAVVVAPGAAAADLDTLRAQGVVAERYDGYAEVRDKGHSGARELVKQVNAERRRIYRERADAKGVPIEQVGRVYARQILEKLPKGAWFLRENGEYLRK